MSEPETQRKLQQLEAAIKLAEQLALELRDAHANLKSRRRLHLNLVHFDLQHASRRTRQALDGDQP